MNFLTRILHERRFAAGSVVVWDGVFAPVIRAGRPPGVAGGAEHALGVRHLPPARLTAACGPGPYRRRGGLF